MSNQKHVRPQSVGVTLVMYIPILGNSRPRRLPMKSYSASALVLLCICLCFGNLHSLKAQDNFTASPTQTDMCVHWINGVVPAMTKLDPVEFCSGRKTSQGGWYSTKWGSCLSTVDSTGSGC